jgi:multiple sugar transport system substrate-binding protein
MAGFVRWLSLGRLGRMAGGLLLAGLPWFSIGCADNSAQRSGPPFAGVELVVAAVGEPGLLEAIRVQSQEWERDSGARLVILPDALGPAEAGQAHVLLFPGQLMGALVDVRVVDQVPESAVRPGTVSPLGSARRGAAATGVGEDEPEAGATRRDPLDFNDVAQPFREQVTKYGDERFAVPLGGSALVLAFRRDAFQSEANQKSAQSAGLTLQPPSTWEELEALARFFHDRDWDGDGEPEAGIALPLADESEGVGTTIFLARSAALGQPPDQFALLFDTETMAARLASPPFVEALKAVVALRGSGPPEISTYDAAAARAAFRQGRVALLIDRAERATQWTDPKSPAAVGVAPLPGSVRVFDPVRQAWMNPSAPNRVAYLPIGGGWMAGKTTKAIGRTEQAAIAYMQSLASPETAQAIVSDPALPMVPVRISHLALGLPDPRAALGVDSRAWGEAVRETYGAPRLVVGLRIPEAEGYLADLASALRSVIRGEKSPEEALQAAAEAWDARTRRLGAARQLWHYRRSLNRLATTTLPPPPGEAVQTPAR